MPSPIPHSGGLTGGVRKEQGRIHRAMLKRDYYGFLLHEGELQPSIRTKDGFMRLPTPFGVGTHCPGHCSPRVALEIRGILTYVARAFLWFSTSGPHRVPIIPKDMLATVGTGLARCLT